MRAGRLYAEGLRLSVRENSTAYGFSIMVTGSLGVVAALQGSPVVWEVFLFALGAALGFASVLVASRQLRADEEGAEQTDVLLVAAGLSVASVLGGVGAAALVAWLVGGWLAWPLAPFAASTVYLLANGLEYAIAEEEEEGG